MIRMLPSRFSKAAMSNGVNGHRYKIGQAVSLAAGFGYSRSSQAVFKVVALLPSNGSHYQYRIRNTDELFERVAAENEMVSRQMI